MAFKICFLLALVALSQGRNINPDSRIINGENVLPGERPYQVSLQTKSHFHFCGGSIISENYVVTAGHCAAGNNDIIVVVGSVDNRNHQTEHQVSKIIVHENYGHQTWQYDIALIKVAKPFVFNKNVSAVPVQKPSDSLAVDDVAVVSGWGRTETGLSPTELKKSALRVVSNKYCADVYKDFGLTIPDHDVCALNRDSPAGGCYGDSGGPLTSNGRLIGLVSGGIQCGDTKYPNVYTRLSSFYDWIQKHTV